MQELSTQNLADTKICVNCNQEKPLYSFPKYKTADGSIKRNAKCNGCKNSPNAKFRTYKPYVKDGVLVKFCVNCETIKPLEQFTKKLNSYGACKPCNSKNSSADFKKASPERLQKKREYAKKYSKLKSSEKNKKRREKYRLDDEYRTRVLNQSNWTPEKKREYKRKYYLKNQEKMLMYVDAYRSRKRGAKIVIKFTKADIIKRDGLICYLCEKVLTKDTATLDHLIPLSRGGNHKPENIKLACKSCNSTKTNKTLSEFKKWRGDYNRHR